MNQKIDANKLTRPVRYAGGIGSHEKDLNALIEVLGQLSERGDFRAKVYVRDGRKNPAKREEWAAGVVSQLEGAMLRLLLRRHRDHMGEFAQSLLCNMGCLEQEYAMEEAGYRLGLMRSVIDLNDPRPYMEEMLIAGAAEGCSCSMAQTVEDVYGALDSDGG